ncbi:hypothetical protein ACFQ3P_42435 [Paraburkholderia sabiae]|uniref:Transposase n=1 Tax=Paraburkholderia sabiae TaxID=273251 RepID=A0ABU9QTF2_9BURK|nr:hypothetical protein [Paraburkholderia sabiae]WJZ79585.1 hypothetical protein QEN71_40610 [Paraburkholderia sabiae]CAD6563388.1 hypothetical protein LMG24235_08632 [Paraburkholderia sabiae]
MKLAQYLQKRGLKPNRHAQYRRYVAAMRGWLESEVGRCLNGLVAVRTPAELVFERLDLRAPGLSRWLNRLISDIGITCRKVIAAYSSQADSARGYVDKNNRTDQAKLKCLWCGHVSTRMSRRRVT